MPSNVNSTNGFHPIDYLKGLSNKMFDKLAEKGNSIMATGADNWTVGQKTDPSDASCTIQSRSIWGDGYKSEYECADAGNFEKYEQTRYYDKYNNETKRVPDNRGWEDKNK